MVDFMLGATRPSWTDAITTMMPFLRIRAKEFDRLRLRTDISAYRSAGLWVSSMKSKDLSSRSSANRKALTALMRWPNK